MTKLVEPQGNVLERSKERVGVFRCAADTGDCTRLLIYLKQDKLVPTIADTV
jgi:hypothetical protein